MEFSKGKGDDAEDEATSSSGHQEPRQDHSIHDFLLEHQKTLCITADNYLPATWNAKYKVDVADMFTDMVLLKDRRKKVDAKPITVQDTMPTLEEVLDIIKSTPACRVLIEGKCGIGKSTLLRYILHNWAMNSDETFKGKILFLVNVRDIEEDEDILDSILRQIDVNEFHLKTNLDPELIKQYIQNHDDEVVLLLDGLDDLLEGSGKNQISLFKRETLSNINVILTSFQSEKTEEFIKESDVHLLVKGFDQSNIRKYIKKYFDQCENPALGDSLIKELQLDSEYLWGWEIKNRLAYYSMCKNPMLLFTVCAIWEDKQYLPVDESDLLKGVLLCILNQYIDRDAENQKIVDIEEIPHKYLTALLVLGRCMYKSLKKNRHSVDKRNFEGEVDVVSLALNLGFVYKEVSVYKEDIFTPPNKIIVEFLVGFYLSKQCQVETFNETTGNEYGHLKSLDECEWEVIKTNEHLEMAQVFAVGLLGADAGEFLKQLIVQDNVSSYRSVVTYLKHVKEENMMAVDKTINDHMSTIELKMKPHITDMSNSLWRCIHEINPTFNANWNFYQLIREARVLESELLKLVNGTEFQKEYSSEILGCVIAHLLIAVENQETFLKYSSCLSDDDAVHGLLKEFKKLNFEYDFTRLYFRRRRFISDTNPLILIDVLNRAPKLTRFELGNCRLTGSAMNAILRDSACRGVLDLKYLDMKYNNLNDIKGVSLASFLGKAPKLNHLTMSNCKLPGLALNEMTRECSDRGIMFKLLFLDISNNNLCDLTGSSLASLLVMAPELNHININNCSLPGVVVNDMVRICSGRGVVLQLEYVHLDCNSFSDIEGASLASLLLMAPELNELNMNNCSLSGDVVNGMVRFSSDRGLVSDMRSIDICNNHLSGIGASSLASLFIMAPKLRSLKLNYISGQFLRDLLREGDIIHVEWKKDILHFDPIDTKATMTDIDGETLAKVLALQLIHGLSKSITTSRYSLSHENLQDLVHACQEHDTKLDITTCLDVSGIDLNSLDRATKTGLFEIFPKLNDLRMRDCSLSGVAMKDMVDIFSDRAFMSELSTLHLSENNLSNIEGASLSSLLVNAPKIKNLLLNSCSLQGVAMNNMVRVCSDRGVVLRLESLDLNCNNLSDIEGASLATLLLMAPKLYDLHMNNCSLSGDVVSDMVRVCSDRGISSQLKSLDISENDISVIDIASLASLLVMIPDMYHLDLSNCRLSSVVSDMIRVCTSREDVFSELRSLVLSHNNLTELEGALLASLLAIAPRLSALCMHNCNLSEDAVNDMVRVCSEREVVSYLSVLDVSNNNIIDIEGASLATLLDILPSLNMLNNKKLRR